MTNTKIPAIRTVKNGEQIHPNARFPIEFIGDWSSILTTDAIDIMADNDTIATSYNDDNDNSTKSVKIQWSEGPLWDNNENCFYCCDPTQGIIFRLDNHQTQSETTTNIKANNKNRLLIWAIHTGGVDPLTVPNIAEPGSNGMTHDTFNSSIVYICQHYTHRIIQCNLSKHKCSKPLSEAPSYKTICDVDKYNNAFNSPNDITTHDVDGSIWFTDPIYGFLDKNKCCDEWSKNSSYLDEECVKDGRTGIKGVYRVDYNTKEVMLMTPFHRRPNGLAFHYSNDQNDTDMLWVADSTIGCPSWTSYPIPKHISSLKTANESSSSSTILSADKVITSATLGVKLGCPTTSSSSYNNNQKSLLGHEGLSDGFKIHNKLGLLWTSIPNGFAIIDIKNTNNKQKPKVICQILLGINTSNITFGRNGEVWLTGANGIWRIQTRM